MIRVLTENSISPTIVRLEGDTTGFTKLLFIIQFLLHVI